MSLHHQGGGRLFDWIFAEVKKKDPPPPVPPPPPPRWSWDVTEIDGCSERRDLKFFLLKTNYNGNWKNLPSFFFNRNIWNTSSFIWTFIFFFPGESYVPFQQRGSGWFSWLFFFRTSTSRGSVQLETPRDWLCRNQPPTDRPRLSERPAEASQKARAGSRSKSTWGCLESRWTWWTIQSQWGFDVGKMVGLVEEFLSCEDLSAKFFFSPFKEGLLIQAFWTVQNPNGLYCFKKKKPQKKEGLYNCTVYIFPKMRHFQNTVKYYRYTNI